MMNDWIKLLDSKELKLIQLLEEFLNHKKINCGFRERTFVAALDNLHTIKKELQLKAEFNPELPLNNFTAFSIAQSIGYLMKVSHMRSNSITVAIIKELEVK